MLRQAVSGEFLQEAKKTFDFLRGRGYNKIII